MRPRVKEDAPENRTHAGRPAGREGYPDEKAAEPSCFPAIEVESHLPGKEWEEGGARRVKAKRCEGASQNGETLAHAQDPRPQGTERTGKFGRSVLGSAVIAASLLLGATLESRSASAEPVCGDRARILENLAAAHSESTQTMGLSADRNVIEVIVEPGPFWTGLFDKSPINEDDPQRVASYGDVASVPSAMLMNFKEFLMSGGAPDPEQAATAIGELANMTGERPLRTVVGVDCGVNDLNRAIEPFQHGLLEGIGMSHVS